MADVGSGALQDAGQAAVLLNHAGVRQMNGKNGSVEDGEECKYNGKPSQDDSGLDQSMEEPLTPEQDSVFHSPSPFSTGTNLSAELELRMRGGSVGSSGRSADVDFGKFYTKSYLKPDAEKGYIKRTQLGTESSNIKSPQSFLKPENFSYSKTVQLGKPRKKECSDKLNDTSAMGALVNSIVKKKVVAKVTSPVELKSEEPKKLSQYPGGNKPKPNEISKIERDDWPAPPGAAAMLSERIRERRKSKGDILEDDDEEEDENPVNPQTQKEIEELGKLSDKSSIGRVIVRDLTKRVEVERHRIMDPRSASRTPSADHEPYQKPRYESPMFASPSRLNVERPHSRWKDEEKHVESLDKTRSLPHSPVVKPGYTYGLASGSRSATLPVGNSPFGLSGDSDLSGDEDSKQKFTSCSTLNGSRKPRSSSYHGNGLFEGPPFFSSTRLDHRSLFASRNNFQQEQEQTYTVEELRNPSKDLGKSLDKPNLEKYLTNEDFEDIFQMKREEFYRQPIFKRNDTKRKMNLF